MISYNDKAQWFKRIIRLNEVTVFIRWNVAAFIKFLVIQVRRLFEGGVYFKSNLFLANNSMVIEHLNFKKQKLILLSEKSFSISFSISEIFTAEFIRGRRLLMFLFQTAAFIQGRRLLEGGV